MPSREWWARINLTGDPAEDGRRRWQAIDAIAESMAAHDRARAAQAHDGRCQCEPDAGGDWSVPEQGCPIHPRAIAAGWRPYWEPPNVCPADWPGPMVFLAGGISGCPDWQALAAALLLEAGIGVFNPRRRHFPWALDDPAVSRSQILWELHHLHHARDNGLVLFWFPNSGRDVPQPIALHELGMAIEGGWRMVVGFEGGYVRRNDVLVRMEVLRPDVTVRFTLDETVADAVRMLHEPRRRGQDD